jgi:mannose-6-phosphate isomerase-like protein (cupin superfamily)
MRIRHLALVLLAAFALAAELSPTPAVAAAEATVTPVANLKWTPAGMPGVSTAVVQGDMAKGPCHFYLKYDAGFVSPMHHHSPDHFVTVVTGTLVLTVDGKEHQLGPGSFFALTGKAKHAARVEGKEPAVMFIDSRGAWDVVAEAAADTK